MKLMFGMVAVVSPSRGDHIVVVVKFMCIVRSGMSGEEEWPEMCISSNKHN